MMFLNPFLLYLLPLAALPVAIHFLNRFRYRRVRWAATALLEGSRRDSFRFSVLRDVALLLLRCAAVVLLVFALARPVVRSGVVSRLGVVEQVERVLVVDDTASMRGAFDDIRRAVSRLLAGTYRWTVLCVASGEVWRSFEDTPGDVARGLSCTDAAGDVAEAVARALDEAVGSGGEVQLVVLSDLQSATWRPRDAGRWEELARRLRGMPGGVLVRVVRVRSLPAANVAVENVSVQPAVFFPGEKVHLECSLGRGGNGGALRVPVRLEVNGEVVAAAEADFPSGGSVAACSFEVEVGGDGIGGAVAVRDGGGLPADDRRYFFLVPAGRLRAVLLSPGEPPRSILLALDPARAGAGKVPVGSAVRLDLKRFGTRDYVLTDYDVAVAWCKGLSALDEEYLLGQLDAFVRRGGVLVLFVAEALPRRLADFLASSFGIVVGRRVAERRSRPMIALAAGKGLLDVLAGFRGVGLSHFSVGKHFSLETNGNARAIVGLSGGATWLVGGTSGECTAYVFASGCDGSDTDLVYGPLFLPLVQQMILSSVKGGGIRSVDAGTAVGKVEKAVAPGGRTLTAGVRPFVPLRAGVYTLVREGGRIEKMGVNVPAEESSLDAVDEGTLKELFGGAASFRLVSVDEAVGGAGAGLWFLLLGGVLLAMMLEVWLEGRNGG